MDAFFAVETYRSAASSRSTLRRKKKGTHYFSILLLGRELLFLIAYNFLQGSFILVVLNLSRRELIALLYFVSLFQPLFYDAGNGQHSIPNP
jgi:hypothetical protein